MLQYFVLSPFCCAAPAAEDVVDEDDGDHDDTGCVPGNGADIEHTQITHAT